jgi:hypothetical protein
LSCPNNQTLLAMAFMQALFVGSNSWISKEEFTAMGAEIMKREPNTANSKFQARWISHFQVDPHVVCNTWELLKIDTTNNEEDKGAQPEHLLWALLFLKTYRAESILAGMCGSVHEDTFRKWAWSFVLRLSYLEFDVVSTLYPMFIEFVCYPTLCVSVTNKSNSLLPLFVPIPQIIWEKRKLGDKGRDCLVDIDGVDCRTTKQGKVAKAFYGHKFKSSGLRYGVGSSIQKGDIIHIDGPHPPGDWNDLMTFRQYVKPKLDMDERVEADAGYEAEDPGTVVSSSGIRFMETQKVKKLRGTIHSRHETINERLKQFKVLSERFHHDIEKHSQCFRACAVLTQLSFEYDKGVFSLEDSLRIGYDENK